MSENELEVITEQEVPLTFFEAIRAGDYDRFKELLPTEDVNQRGVDNTTPLIDVVYAGNLPNHWKMLNDLLSHKDIQVDLVDSAGLTALSVAAVRNPSFLEPLLQAGANPNVMTVMRLTGGMSQYGNDYNQWRRMSLLSAVLLRYGKEEFELLQSYGADVNVVGDLDVSPLSLAGRMNNRNAMEYLVEKAGADIEVLPTNWRDFTANPKKACSATLRKVLKYGSAECLDYLLEKGINVPPIIYRADNQYATPMTYLLSQPVWGSEKNKYEHTAKVLYRWMKLQNYAATQRGEKPLYEIDRLDSQGRSALHFAAVMYSASLCKKLLKPELIHQKDKNGITPFGLAIRRGALDVIQVFLDNGANPNEAINCLPMTEKRLRILKFSGKETPIFYAMKHKNEPLARLLIEAGANVLLRDSDGKRPTDYLDNCFSPKFTELLQQTEAKQTKSEPIKSRIMIEGIESVR